MKILLQPYIYALVRTVSSSNSIKSEKLAVVGIFNGGHANKLEKAGIQVANIHDVNDFLPSQENHRSYKQVIEASRIDRSFHGFDLDPAITNSEWSKPELDGPQISQAAADAFVRYKIGVKQGVR